MRKFLFVSLVLMLTGFASWAQRTVTGKVTDANGNPVPSASVLIQNTRTGTVTKADGSFSINVPANSRMLVVSAVGFGAQEIEIGNQSTYSVSLRPSADQSMAEVVVTAMGIRRSEKALGYSVAKVDPTTTLQKSEPNLLNTLAGKVPGVDIRAGQGAPGAATRIQIRGVSSFQGGEPLIVVDGVPYSNPIVGTSNSFTGGGTYGSGLNNLDPNDIESINVLKGAAAASLWGSRAANGVLLITTKSGAPKKGAKSLNVTYRAGYSIEKIADIPEFQNLYGAGANFRTQSSNGSWGARFGKGVIYNSAGQVIGTSASGVDSIPASTWATMSSVYPELFPNGRLAYKAVPDNVFRAELARSTPSLFGVSTIS